MWTDEYIVPDGAVFEEWTVIVMVGSHGLKSFYPPTLKSDVDKFIADLIEQKAEFDVYTETRVTYPQTLALTCRNL